MARRRLTRGAGAAAPPEPAPPAPPSAPGPAEPASGRAAPAPEAHPTRSTVVQHGAGWVAAIAAVAGVLITAIVTFGGGAGPAPAATPVASTVAGPAGSAVASSATTAPTPAPTRTSSGHTPAPASAGPLGPVLADATSGADIVATIAAPDLPGAGPHTLIPFGPTEGLSFEAPDAWAAGGMGGPWIYGNNVKTGTAAVAAPSERAFYDTLASSGLFVGGSPDMTIPIAPLTEEAFGRYWKNCTFGGRGAYDDGTFAGLYELYGPCGTDSIRIVGMVVRDEATNRTVGMDLHLTTQADMDAAARIIDSIRYEP